MNRGPTEMREWAMWLSGEKSVKNRANSNFCPDAEVPAGLEKDQGAGCGQDRVRSTEMGWDLRV